MIERLDLTNVSLEVSDIIEPRIKNPYPDVVARVNGEEITGKELLANQIGVELEQRGDIYGFHRAVLIPSTFGSRIRPLETLVDIRLMEQAAVRLNLVSVRSREVNSEREEDIANVGEPYGAEVRELLRLQGLPTEGWTATDAYINSFSLLEGVMLVQRDECPTGPGFELPLLAGCPAFLAEERENAEIEYFVVWAE